MYIPLGTQGLLFQKEALKLPVEVTFTYEDDEKLSKIKSIIMENYDGFDKIKEVECDDSEDECQVNQTT